MKSSRASYDTFDWFSFTARERGGVGKWDFVFSRENFNSIPFQLETEKETKMRQKYSANKDWAPNCELATKTTKKNQKIGEAKQSKSKKNKDEE